MKFLLTVLLAFSPVFLSQIQFVLTNDWLAEGHHKISCSSGAPLWPQPSKLEKETGETAAQIPFDPACLAKKPCTTICFESTNCKLKEKKYDWISGVECNTTDDNSDQNCTYTCCHSEVIRVGKCEWVDIGDNHKIQNSTDKVIREIKWSKNDIKAVEVCKATLVPNVKCPRDPKEDPLQFKKDPSINPAGQPTDLLGLLGLLGLTALVAVKATTATTESLVTTTTSLVTTTTTSLVTTTTTCKPATFLATPCSTDADCILCIPPTHAFKFLCMPSAGYGNLCSCVRPGFFCLGNPCCDGSACLAYGVCPPAVLNGFCQINQLPPYGCATGTCQPDAIYAAMDSAGSGNGICKA